MSTKKNPIEYEMTKQEALRILCTVNRATPIQRLKAAAVVRDCARIAKSTGK